MPVSTLISSAREVLLRPKGEMSRKNDDQLNTAIDLDEKLSTWCGGLVVIGLIIEIGLAWLFPPFDPLGKPGSFHAWIERWGSVIADSLVALGVIGEIAFARHVRRGEEELRKRSNDKLGAAERAAAEANNRAAETSAATEQLRAENLTLHRVMMPRHIGAIGIDGPPPAQLWFAGMHAFAGADVFIQYAPDAEAQNLANEIALVLGVLGWRPRFTDDSQSHVSLTLFEGVRVMSSYLDDRPWTAEDTELIPYTNCAHAGDALAHALTSAGLGVGNFRLHRTGFASLPSDDDKRSRMIPWFEPPSAMVYVQVGARPIAATLQWLASQRKSPPQAGGSAQGAAETNAAARA